MTLPSMLRALVLPLVGAVTVAAAGAGEAQGAEAALLQPTPLILKDGRIANVSVHVLAFETGRTGLGGSAIDELADLTSRMATDCFLTAQVIGHVAPAEVSADDTLSAHRIARSRADAVQAALIEGGLPARSIASVWDWQFLVPEARATLWMFLLSPGEDCDGTPLGGAAARVAAAAPTTEGAAADDAPPDAARFVGQADAAAPSDRSPEATAATRAPESEIRTVPAGPARAASGPVESRTLPASQAAPPSDPPTAEPQARAETAIAAVSKKVPRTPPVSPTRPMRPRGRGSLPNDHPVAITFATNSSHFPPGTSERLDELIASHAGEGPYRVRIDVAVSGSGRVVGAESPEEAARYNRWLAERRLERLQDWFAEHASGEVEIEPVFHENDGSRQLVVRVMPVG